MMRSRCAVVLVFCLFSTVAAATPFASSVVSYDPGTNPAAGYTDPATVLGPPERFTGEGVFPGAVTPFNAPFGADEIVSIGEGGSLIVSFDEPIIDDPANPFGIDLLIFGNAFYFDTDFPNGIAGALANDGGIIELSQDGLSWHAVPGVDADGGFPTLGYLDLAGPFDPSPGTMPTDFLLPVDPSFDPTGLSFDQIVAGYNGSGGGAGVDLAAVELTSAQFVRITNPIGSGVNTEIDAFARVPGPAAPCILLGALFTGRRRRA